MSACMKMKRSAAAPYRETPADEEKLSLYRENRQLRMHLDEMRTEFTKMRAAHAAAVAAGSDLDTKMRSFICIVAIVAMVGWLLIRSARS